jgi:membrane-bound metal-dependent hydrolase YbcI (DUF457 family)
MFIGHFALGFAAKRAVPRVSLAMLFMAAQFADLLWPVFVLTGIEQVRIDPGNTAFTPLDFVSYPWSHSLLMLAVWGVCLGAAYRSIAGGRRTFVVLAALVLSHWLLDWATHGPDMPIYPGGPKVGLGLWNSVPATLIVETLLYAIGLGIYLRSTRARDGVGRWGLLTLAATLMVIYTANAFGGPPPSVEAIGIAGLSGGALIAAWAWWADAHRDPVRALVSSVATERGRSR